MIESGWPSATRARRPSTAAGAACVAFFVLLVGWFRVGDDGYWFDETISALVVRRSFGGLARVLWDQEAGMFAYFVGLWFWSQLFAGDNGLRMFSVLGGAVAAALLFILATHWFNQRTAATACLLMITNPFFLRYLTEARAYTWISCVALATAIVFERALESRRLSSFAAFGLLTGIGASLHILAVLVPLTLVVIAILQRRLDPNQGTPIAIAIVTAALCFAPAVPALLANSWQADWIPEPSVDVVRGQIWSMFGRGLPAIVLGVGMICVMVTVAIRPSASPELLLCFFLALAYTGLTLLVSLIQPVFLARYLMPAFPFAVLAASAGIDVLLGEFSSSKRVPILALAAVSLAGALSFVTGGPFTDRSGRSSARDAVQYVEQHFHGGDAIVIASKQPEILHHVGYRPDIDPAALPPLDNQLYPDRLTTGEIATELVAAERVFVFVADGIPVEAALVEFVQSREIEKETRFGEWVVLEVE